MPISPVSIASLLLQPTANGQNLGSGTGFVFTHLKTTYLVTNWHVLSGRDRTTGQPLSQKTGATPDTVNIRYLRLDYAPRLVWFDAPEALHDDEGNPLWFEHPRFGRQVDVAVLPVTLPAPAAVHSYDAAFMEPSLRAQVSDWVNIVGFPFGLSGGGSDGSSYAVWTKGAIATEMDLDYDGLPCFLVDSRSRRGQSGSPVINYVPSGGTASRADGGLAFVGEPVTELLGVYSGRINDQSDLGHVWKARVILDIIRSRTRGNNDLRQPGFLS